MINSLAELMYAVFNFMTLEIRSGNMATELIILFW